MGAWLAGRPARRTRDPDQLQRRRFLHGGPRQLARCADPQDRVGLDQHDGELVLGLPLAHGAVVPHRPKLWPQPCANHTNRGRCGHTPKQETAMIDS